MMNKNIETFIGCDAEYAEARMKEYHDKAVDVLLRLPESEARISLIQLADYIMTRSK